MSYVIAWLMFLLVLLLGGFTLNKQYIHPWYIGAYWCGLCCCTRGQPSQPSQHFVGSVSLKGRRGCYQDLEGPRKGLEDIGRVAR